MSSGILEDRTEGLDLGFFSIRRDAKKFRSFLRLVSFCLLKIECLPARGYAIVCLVAMP